MIRKIVFITGTRADYGKIKPLLKAVEKQANIELFVFVSGMHLLEKYGSTFNEVINDNYSNVYVDFSENYTGIMSFDLGNTICNLTGYIKHINPDMIVVHGDRIDALAGAVVGALNNILVAHIEGGELSGTIDESIRHAISKLAHIHLVCNKNAKQRLIQLGEEEKRIYVIGSPDIDIMLSENLPCLEDAKKRYGIEFEKYAIMMYHPVTTEFSDIQIHIKELVDALIESNHNYVVIYPNNDYGTEVILSEYERLKNKSNFRVFPSIRFEYFLTLLRNAQFMIGNSSAGIRETGVYGIPAIDIGTRQTGRYLLNNSNIQHCNENKGEILSSINNIEKFRKKIYDFGKGKSTDKFIELISSEDIWNCNLQKQFVDM